MTRDYFKQLLAGNNAIQLNDEWIVFNDLELYSFTTRHGYTNKSYDDLFARKVGDVTVGEIIDSTDEFTRDYDGGRGSSSSTLGGGFNHADRRGKGNNREVLLPAELNLKTAKGNSVESVLKRFNSKYGNADREYGIAVDENGYVHQHIKGARTSVAISGDKGQTIIHNHPSGGNFSDTDLISTASSKAKGIIATSSNTSVKSTYTFTKTDRFDAKGFIKAVKTAKWPTSLGYDKGADWWLRRNAKKYGYKYSARGVK